MRRAKLRVCSRPGCPTLVPGGGLCPADRADAERQRATPAERGYDAAHRAERKRWLPIVQAGGVLCSRCGHRIQPGSDWDLGHTDDRTAWTGPEHAACNRADGARRGNAHRIG